MMRLDPLPNIATTLPAQLLTVALNFVLPPRCASCGVQTGSTGGLCTKCWIQARFIAAPQCSQCGYPFELDFGDGVRCGPCLSRPPYFDRARAAVAYDDRIGHIVIAFKHGDRADLAPGLAAWMRRAGGELLQDADLVAPVPLHRRRLFSRRYNQSSLLGQPLARAAGIPFIGDLVIRQRETDSQGHLSPAARRRNVEGAFRVAAHHKDMLKDKRVLLIDDVLTTGATVNAIARRLKREGARAVDVLTVTRVVRETSVS